MASTLADANNCCSPCESPTTVAVPGPQGVAGANGSNGTNGVSPFTTFTALFTIPAELATAVATVGDTSWMVIGQKLYGSRTDGSIHAFLEVSAIGGATSVTLKNLEDTASSAYVENSAPGATLTIGSFLDPAGIQGPSGLIAGGAAGGDLKGTYPNPKILVGNTKGSSLWGNGTDTVAVAAATNGHMLAYDSTDAEGIKAFKALPLTADTDVADNRLPRLDRPAGTEVPSPLQSSKVTVTDNGAIRADGSGGNARGTDAIDLQVTRAGAAQVASGTNSTIGGGQNNTASNTGSTVAGGVTNSATGIDSTVAGGTANVASGLVSSIGGGTTNAASGTGTYIGGGSGNIANTTDSSVCAGSTNTAGNAGANTRAFVGGGFLNTASGLQSTVAGGGVNTASARDATVAGGENNTASGAESTVGGGTLNVASGPNSTIPGGNSATADKHGQVSYAAGKFSTAGDCQTSELQWRINTTDATANVEAFLDGASLRATIPNNTSWVFDILHIGRSSAGVTAAWRTVGAIQNNAGTTALVAAVTNTLIADGTGGTWGAVGNVPVVDADNGNDALRIRVTGAGATLIHWTSIVRLAQLIY